MSSTDYLPFVSNMFLHGGWLHLILNMWTLWLFGRAVEDQLGSLPYLAFYFACGLLASVTHAALNPTSTVPALGASGAIAGVLGCYYAVSVLANRRHGSDPFLPLFFRGAGNRLRRIVVSDTGAAGHRRMVRPVRRRRGRLVGSHRAASSPALYLPALLLPPRRGDWPRNADRGIPGFALSGIV